jgi:hypothetical protein
MADLTTDVLLADGAEDVDPALLDAVSVRERLIDRLADIMIAAEDVRELAEIARVEEPDFLSIDRLMQHFYDETNDLMHRFAD